ncbi:ribose-5-phosphate isomerase RpiA [Convivina praedatoris]|uniref:Ribose-5-phosphate isomerase A n=1 Tax=Convivina praedatoris TaxID=2880963 RepID=A0ABN8HDN9_9LACO|nr:ribose-5-phosphate isomerase RpiA [Convivina sp. LMG 32447]CAH1855442.1 Ribose-5-phosphate isomerase A [Convivina sp. LMG 32447]CAH1856098.1 Ribose-5-phosphate isomerase A [Convivina sp. LMG 32447]CAH1856478.1 Ribose-5-phosphate isomerase A [Convivina sp. LMG 32447]
MDNGKLAAAKQALDYMPNQGVIGLGSGSTASIFIELLAQKVQAEQLDIICVATSTQSQKLGAQLGLNVVDIDEVERIDITVDGADEVDPDLNGIKGGGAALLFEKIVALNSDRNIWVVDPSKEHERLGQFKLPIEVIKFGSHHLYRHFEKLGLSPSYRQTNGEYLLTDSNNYIIDVDVSGIDDLTALATQLDQLTGVVEHGLFLNICDELIVGGQ